MRGLGLKLSRLALKHSLLVIILTALVTLGAASLLPQIKLDNSVDVFFDKKSKAYIQFEKWKEQFGSDQVVMVAFSFDDIFTPGALELISRLTERLGQLRYVDKVTSITNVNNVIGSEEDFIVRPLFEEIPSDAQELARIKEDALANPLYLKNLISADAKTTAIIIELTASPGTGAQTYKKEVVEGVYQVFKEEFPKNRDFYVSGHTAIEHFYARFMQDDLKTFMPLILLILLVILIFSFRTLPGVAMPLAVTLISLIWTMAFLQVCGFAINNVTTVIPPIMLSITLLESIHFVWELILKGNQEKDPQKQQDEILSETMRHLFVPCFLTNVTTVVGFFSLMVSRIPPVRQLGLVAGVGVFFAFITTFTFLPACIKQFNLLKHLCKKQVEKQGDEDIYGFSFLKDSVDKALFAIIGFSSRYRKQVLLVTLVLAFLSVWGASRIKAETSVLEYFKKNSTVYKATTYIEEHLSGVHLLNISLKADKPDYFKDPLALAYIEGVQKFLSTLPAVDKSTSCLDYLKEIHKSFHNEFPEYYRVPETKELVSQYVLLYGADDLDDFCNADWSWTTIRIRLKEHSTVKLKKIIEDIEYYLHKNSPKEITYEIVGQTVLEVDSNEAVTSGQVQSLSLAMILIFGMMFVDFRSFSVGTLSIIPNLLPLLFGFGIMGLARIRLDSATSMIADIGIGIIVDDTIHFFHSFGEGLKRTGGDYQKALYQAFALKGKPTFITSLILILGFGVVGFSNFVPTYYFGVLSALLIFNGLWAELFLTPALLMFFKPKFK